jgi:hypothetical protein
VVFNFVDPNANGSYTKQGAYTETREWETKAGFTPDDNYTFADLGSDFKTAVQNIGIWPSSAGTDFNPRGYLINELSPSNYGSLMINIKDGMKTQITDALGLTGVANADAMALALINQMQDFEEFRALIDDFKGADALHNTKPVDWQYDLDPALDYNYSFTIAQAQTQSSPHLAHIDPKTQFQPDAVKTAYGKQQEQLPLDAVKPGPSGGDYTVNVIPRKDESAA